MCSAASVGENEFGREHMGEGILEDACGRGHPQEKRNANWTNPVGPPRSKIISGIIWPALGVWGMNLNDFGFFEIIADHLGACRIN